MATVRNALGAALDLLPSKAARHRWLKDRRLIWETYATFIKYWRSGADWSSSNVDERNARAVAQLLGIDPSPFDADLEHVEHLRAATWIEIEAIPTGIEYLKA